MDEEQIDPPFEKLYVAVVGDTKRAYTKQGPARARITNAVGRNTNRFEDDCELWEVSDAGWELILKCEAGEYCSSIPWNDIAKTRKARADRERQWRQEHIYAVERQEYERLRQKFEGK